MVWIDHDKHPNADRFAQKSGENWLSFTVMGFTNYTKLVELYMCRIKSNFYHGSWISLSTD